MTDKRIDLACLRRGVARSMLNRDAGGSRISCQHRPINRTVHFRLGERERLGAICVEQALNGNVRFASGGTVSVPTRHWNPVAFARDVQRGDVRTDAFIVVFEKRFQRFRSNAGYSTSQSGCTRSIRRCTEGAFALCRKNSAEQRSKTVDLLPSAGDTAEIDLPDDLGQCESGARHTSTSMPSPT